MNGDYSTVYVIYLIDCNQQKMFHIIAETLYILLKHAYDDLNV